MSKGKLKKLTSLFKDFARVREEKINAEYDICSASIKDSINRSCINVVSVIGNFKNSRISLGCRFFKQDKICVNKKCPMWAKNVNYVTLFKKYQNLRKEFFDELFNRKIKRYNK